MTCWNTRKKKLPKGNHVIIRCAWTAKIPFSKQQGPISTEKKDFYQLNLVVTSFFTCSGCRDGCGGLHQYVVGLLADNSFASSLCDDLSRRWMIKLAVGPIFARSGLHVERTCSCILLHKFIALVSYQLIFCTIKTRQ